MAGVPHVPQRWDTAGKTPEAADAVFSLISTE